MNESTHQQTVAPAPVSVATQSDSFIKRELNGATFLSLEHAAHMALVVIVAGLLAAAIGSALNLWIGSPLTTAGSLFSALTGGPMTLEATMAIGLVAALVVLVPLMVVLDRRTRAEWTKRPDYAHRLAYKVPVYGALAALVVAKTVSVISMLTVVITSLVVLGVKGTDFGSMYMHQFLPALLAAAVFGAAAWYVFKLAKGNDFGKGFSAAVAVLGASLVIALTITSAVILHGVSSSSSPKYPSASDYYNDNSSRQLEDVFNY